MAISVKSLGCVFVVFLVASVAAQNVELPPPPPQIAVPAPIQQLPPLEPMPQPMPMPEPMPSPQPMPMLAPAPAPSFPGPDGCSIEHPCEHPHAPHPHMHDLDKCREYARTHGYSDSHCDVSTGSNDAPATTRAGYGVTDVRGTTPRPVQTDEHPDDGPGVVPYVIGAAVLLGIFAIFRRRNA
jgi:hypothetical protein